MLQRTYILLLLALFSALGLQAQRLPGRVIDAATGEAIPFVNVYYQGGKGGVQTDAHGRFSIALRKGARLQFSSVGYQPYATRVQGTDSLIVRLQSADFGLSEAKVVTKKQKYSRKNNPAVELMRKVIAAKKLSDLKRRDYYSVQQYNKLTMGLCGLTPEDMETGRFKRMQFLKQHVEVAPETGKMVMPLTVDEKVTERIYRRRDNTEKEIILGQRSEGINDLFSTGDIVNTMLHDAFTEVNIYENNIHVLRNQFISPLSSSDGIAFYRYFLADTTMVEGERCIEVQFTPNNSQDFGFSGQLFVLADSTYRVKKVEMGVPVNNGVNFVEMMRISQSFEQLPSGEQVLKKDNMFILLRLIKGTQKFQVRRNTAYSNFSFEPIADKAFRFTGKSRLADDAMMKEQSFWRENRPEQLTQTEDRMGGLVKQLQAIPGLKPVIWTAKAFIENFVETSLDPEKPSKVDIGPINTTFGSTEVDGFRLRASAQTTAHFHPQFFLRGYLAYGFKDERFKGMAEATYSFNKKRYLPREFPVSNLRLSYRYDVITPSDAHLPTDKDNVFLMAKWTNVDHMMYNQNVQLAFEKEWENGFRVKAQLAHDTYEPTAALFYQPIAVSTAAGTALPLGTAADLAAGFDPAAHNVHKLRTAGLTFAIEYQPGATFINTKQRRIRANRNAPIFSLQHTVGIKDWASDYTHNTTDAGIYYRWWVKSWGKMDFHLKGGAQWNRVPFPLLPLPAANASYIREDGMFNLVKNMEFINDRYLSFMWAWDLNGKILNRIPLIRRLKWREHIGINTLWGTLTDQNNPYLAQNAQATDLYHFPVRFLPSGIERQSRTMDGKTPYVEVTAGLHNILKIIHVQYVHRLTYLNPEGSPYGKTQRWGIRFMLRATF